MIPIKLPKEHKAAMVDRVKSYFEEERSETIGDMAAEQILDYMLKEIGPYIYNKAIADVRLMMDQKAVQIEEELYAMEKPFVNRSK